MQSPTQVYLNNLISQNTLLKLATKKSHFISSTDTSRELLALAAISCWQKLIIVTAHPKEATYWLSLLENNNKLLSGFGAVAAHLPQISLWGADRFINPSTNRNQRLDALYRLADPSEKAVIVTTIGALAQSTFTIDDLRNFTLQISVDQMMDQDNLVHQLENSGYRPSTVVDEEGLFSIRGSVIDVFAPNSPNPFRIEFFGDTVTAIRAYSLETQKSISSFQKINVGPANEILIGSDRKPECAQRLHDFLINLEHASNSEKDGFRSSFLLGSRPNAWELLGPVLRKKSQTAFDLISGSACFLFSKGYSASLRAHAESLASCESSYEGDIESGRVSLAPNLFFASSSMVSERLSKFDNQLEIGNLTPSPQFQSISLQPELGFEPVSPTLSLGSRYEGWIQAIQNILQIDEGKVGILISSSEQRDRLLQLLKNRSISIATQSPNLIEFLSSAPDRNLHIFEAHISNWTWMSQNKTLIIPDHLIFGAPPKKIRSNSAKLKNYLSSFKDLRVGDFVVHTIHGIARYKGMTSLTIGGLASDFLLLEYAGTDKIYLPVDKLNLLQRYSSSEGSPIIDKLGSGSWEKKREKVKEAVKIMADKILKNQAMRATSHIHIYQAPTEDYFRFESEFPFNETDDQPKAIAEVNADLESNKPMDRLICGDVGFGKTEVALRAAFRVVNEGFQVLVLVPTTILCYQHFRTFRDRMSRHGIRVAQLNRFVPTKTQKETIDDVASGKVDILIGTHRLLSEDIKTRRLGLIIVDEEQRFGVTHKERLKELKSGADILTLTATPIPRTLHMSMLGLKAISLISTPPINRISVKTYIAAIDDGIIRDAINHEIDRGGQVFFLHNRVEDIESVCTWVSSLSPKATVKFAHGQMKESDLEQTIIDFLEQKFDVLVCTTIIESGIDMPNVNTLLVHDADKFGLSQLYQMRGRVGRASTQAYAYFLVKDPANLTDEAQKRLEVLATHQDLGAGFQIASHDLELRGAGNLLGAEQSGHASEVGLEMYTDLLGEAIAEIQGNQPTAAKHDPEIKLPISAVIPESYISNENLRLQFYKSVFSAQNIEDLRSLEAEIRDRFGLIPDETIRLLLIAELKIILIEMSASQIHLDSTKGFYELRFGTLSESQVDLIISAARKQPTKYRLSPDYRLYIYSSANKTTTLPQAESQTMILRELLDLMYPLVANTDQPI